MNEIFKGLNVGGNLGLEEETKVDFVAFGNDGDVLI
jgi:hypothetical protein